VAHVPITLRQASGLVQRLEDWLGEWRRFGREIRAQAELERKLKGVDDYLLRDMGLKWTGRRLERIDRDEAF
jgi:hypothetical protein